jgi:hypothetical protein
MSFAGIMLNDTIRDSFAAIQRQPSTIIIGDVSSNRTLLNMAIAASRD